ncbi:AAA family ATPase [Nocardia takedensis]|uniref:AAA family ATPase n=1 Tax=Nocardia takedensis TaxID=259390 RepID=UPI003F76380B
MPVSPDNEQEPAPQTFEHYRPVFQASEEVVEAVNAALLLRRPLLVTGRPGSGKSALIESVANELTMGPVLRWNIGSRSTVDEALYRYDAIGRLHAERLTQFQTTAADPTSIRDYLRLGPLGTALVPVAHPRALLIDEIDKSDIDLPNDLLNIFERGEFEIPELARMRSDRPRRIDDAHGRTVRIRRGLVRCAEFPFVVLTSNGDREFPPAFLRRCIRIRMPDPDAAMLARIVAAHLGEEAAGAAAELITDFADRYADTQTIATDQLMNAIHLVTGRPIPPDERERLIRMVLKQLVPDIP